MVGLVRVAAVTAGCVGGIGTAVYRLMLEQSRSARRTIGPPRGVPPLADGVYLPDGSGPLPPLPPATAAGPPATDGAGAVAGAAGVLRLAMLGDSSAAGLGAECADLLPGVVVARGLAEESGRPVRLDTHAVSGSTSRRLGEQVDLALPGRPHVVVLLIGANDVTHRIPPQVAAALLGDAVRRLRDAGVAVVVGTCPDLGIVRPVQQPLRGVLHTWSLALARFQRAAVQQAGGVTVPLADLLAADFLARDDYFSDDRFHPSGLGYAAAAAVLLPGVCAALGLLGVEHAAGAMAAA